MTMGRRLLAVRWREVALAGLLAIAPIAVRPMPAAGQEDVAQRVELCRKVIENAADTESTRISQAEQLLLAAAPAATDALVALLSSAPEPSTKLVVCQAVSNMGKARPELLDDRLIDPLAALLGDASPEVAARAGEALAAFPNVHVVRLLGYLAADGQTSANQRLAAVAALSSNTSRRVVVGEIVGLLEVPEPAVHRQVLAALARISAVDHGDDPAAWKQWWSQEIALSDADWLQQQVRVLTRRLREADAEQARLREQVDKRQAQLLARLALALADVYRLTPSPPQRDDLLVGWLNDPAIEVRQVAVTLVAEQISEGNAPGDVLREALHTRYSDESADVRQAAIETIGALNDPAEAGSVISRLSTEHDQRVRETVLRVLGKLRNHDALDPLIAELESADVSDGCLIAAAEAIGTLAGKGPIDSAAGGKLVAVLKDRFAKTAAESRTVRAALLQAMAAVGAAEFAPEFRANLSAGDVDLLLGAIRGAAAVGDRSQLARLVELTGHPDARVRQRALGAVGALGDNDQLAAILDRLGPPAEPVEAVREAAQIALGQLADRMPVGEQIAVADRLPDPSPAKAEYLRQLHERLGARTPPLPETVALLEKLARQYSALGRHAESLPYWRQLYDAAVQGGDPRIHEFGLALLQCSLACNKTDRLDAIMRRLSEADEPTRAAAAKVVIDFLEQLRAAAPDQVDDVVAKLRQVSPNQFPDLAAYLDARSRPPATAPAGRPGNHG